MNSGQFESLKKWFVGYVAGFYGSDDFVNANLKLKEDHTQRVCEEMAALADKLKLSGSEKLIAETIALFHDIGRFEQFTKHRTYNDGRSINHALLGLEVLKNENVLSSIQRDERVLIEKAIELHGDKEIPAGLDDRIVLLLKLIRDVDKLDILYVVTEAYAQYHNNPANFKLEIEFPDTPVCSPAVVAALLAGKRIDYKQIQTLNDAKLLQLGWVYDVNFAATLQRIKRRRLLEKLVDFLPDGDDIRAVTKKVFDYVDKRIETGT